MEREFDHKGKRNEQLKQRREHGLKYRELADDFAVSISQAHRIANKDKDND